LVAELKAATTEKMVNLKGINKDRKPTVPCYRPSGTVTLAVKANLGQGKWPDIRGVCSDGPTFQGAMYLVKKNH
jgi:hypothetical protein